MSEYRRIYENGASYFFTVVTHKRQNLFSSEVNIRILKQSFQKIKKNHPFQLNAMVILPDHLHCIWRLPLNDADYSKRWRLIKSDFSKKINTPINSHGRKEVWQSRFWEHIIINDRDWREHMNYIHYNPVKHGLVSAPKDWRHSSFHYWVFRGFYDVSWGGKQEG